jgi:hypothetical protein
MAKDFENLIFGGLHEKHAVQRGIWVPTQSLAHHFQGDIFVVVANHVGSIAAPC